MTYGNSVWLASMGTVGKTVLGIYQISELVTSILVNPFGGVISDRFFPSQDFDDDRLGLWSPLFGHFLYHRMIVGWLQPWLLPILSRPWPLHFLITANKAIITEVVEKDEIVTYNAHLELVLQVVGVSSPVFSFLVLQFASLHVTLLLDALTFSSPLSWWHSFRKKKPRFRKETFYGKRYFFGHQGWTRLYLASKEIFFLLLVASSVNFFCSLWFLLPFSNRLYGVQRALMRLS